MSTFRFHALAIAIAAITLILPPLARAADTPVADAVDATDGDAPIRALDAVQVQGSLLGRSKPDDVQRYAGSRQVIDREQLRNGGTRSLDDALQRVPGIKIFDETGTGALPQIMLRGLYESRSGRVQVLEDGIPLALAPYGQTSLSLFPVGLNQIDRIDIVRGGAAVQYGPNNVGGVINLVSKEIPSEWSTTLAHKVAAGGQGQFLQDSALSSGGYLTDNFGMQVDANRTSGEYWRAHSDTDISNLRVRAEWWLDDTTLLKASVQRYLVDMDLAGALSPDDYRRDPRQSTRPLDSFNGRTTRASLSYEQLLGDWGPMQDVRLDWTNFNARSSRNFIVGMRQASSETWRSDLPPQLRQTAPRDFRVVGSEPRLSWTMGDAAGVRQQWTAGVRAVREDIDFLVGNLRLRDGLFTTVRDWQFEDRALAAYVSNAITLPDARVTVTPGLRYERLDSRYFNRATGVSTLNQTRDVLPGLTLGFQANEQWFFYADGQRSMRAPQVTQIIFGNNLDAELAWNYEAGTRYQPNERTRIQLGGYLIDFDQQIQLDNTTRVFRNLGKTRHQGGELELQWSPEQLRAFTLNASYAYLDASQESGKFRGFRVPYTSRNQITLGGTYALGHTTVALSGYYFSKAFSDAANTVQENAIASVGQLPSYMVWNTQVSHTLFERDGQKFSASLAINNLFDRQYWFRGVDTSPWGRQAAPARTVTAGLEYTF
ncbi:TonB-dependent receptor family protein [Xanthomonas vasicola]|uniref:TonB-dependent siderophore receptor n=1 Tax=Xanthomonas vasicola TaxID=56459 RepID=A0ABD7S5I2_XANVA|nr:TonB-dependent siderophore receptor [Xanthomonas vasicola]KGR38286.1 TonB-dependent receptor [Xanthomonas vasicola]KGR38500.1 TonB-dependent receptor [Xanthomonas vasicola]KGR58224.1 TonB-dependent receptor [Xanthomonas vasicola]MDO6986368.1 TonB-dependent siderophore receptor [Xanthomonas vasicola]PPV01082.1 TonB-dependent siderophore receptor [Xanthomonas vasicola]